MEFAQPLSDEELDELDRFLSSDAMPEESMDVSMLDGFLTALIVGPNTLLPSVWLPEVWGATSGQPVQWESPQQEKRIVGLVMRHMSDIVWQLKEAPDHYEPLLFENDREDEPSPIIDEWCTGFIRGATLDGDAWAPLFESEDHSGLLFPMMLYGTEAGWQELQGNPELGKRHKEFADSLSDCVLAIQDYWLPVRKAKSTIRHEQAVPGRNDPCPCGSGKKFKKCCGSPAKLN
ncbi:MAG: UPF0149 family protein [Ignavibacteria bacterium]